MTKPSTTEDSEKYESVLFDLAQLKTLGGFKAGDLLAVDPQLYEKFMKHRSKTVKHDDVVNNMTFLAAISAYTDDPINFFLKGQSSIGKTYNATESVKYFPTDDVWLLGSLSPKALVYSHGKLIDANGEEINFKDKPEKPNKTEYSNERDYREALAEYKDQKQTWTKRLEKSKYLVDLTGKILVFLESPQFKTFNMLRPILSHDASEISYRITDKTAKGQLKTKHTVLRGYPATIFCSTKEKYVQDLATRGFTATPETTPEKYRDANVLTGSRAAFPWKFEQDFDFMLLQGYIRFLKNTLGNYKVSMPYAKDFAKEFPNRFPRSMRDFKHILNLIKVSALFHVAQRPLFIRKVKDKEECYIMATRHDYEFVMSLWEQVKETTETSASGHVMKFYHEVVEKVADKYPEFLVQDLVDEWNSKFEDKRSSDTVRKWVDFLCDVGYMNKQPNPADKRSNLLTVIKRKNGNNTQSRFPEFFTLDSLKAWFKEVKQILEKSQVLFRENLVHRQEVSLEEIYEKYFLYNTKNFSNIKLSGSKPSSAEKPMENTDNQQSVYFLNFKNSKTRFTVADIKKLERLTTNIQDRCVVCEKSGCMDWQVTLHNDSWGMLCGACGIKLAEKLGKAE